MDDFGLKHLHYTYQEGGIAEALGLAEDFADGNPLDAVSIEFWFFLRPSLGSNLLTAIRPLDPPPPDSPNGQGQCGCLSRAAGCSRDHD
jgi:hypothetical protein